MIGTNVTGTAALANGGAGVDLANGASDNTIGGATVAQRNIISGNATNGVNISGASSANETIAGNFIGVDITGEKPLANSVGVFVSGTASTTIGGIAAAAGNVISGNTAAGIELNGSAATGVLIALDRIGTNAGGTAAVVQTGQSNPLQALQNVGVAVISSAGNTVGGVTAGASNLISGNYVGVMLADVSGPGTANLVQGNLIGTDISGSLPVGNIVGVYINSAAGNQIGGATAAAQNVISGNSSVGIEIYGSGSTANQIEGNIIGLAADGHSELRASNGLFIQQNGVFVNGASGNAIGGSEPGAGNVIAGNEGSGVFILNQAGTASGNIIEANLIGLAQGGATGPGNDGYGILLANSPHNTIARTGPTANRFGRNGIADIRYFFGTLGSGSSRRGVGQPQSAASIGSPFPRAGAAFPSGFRHAPRSAEPQTSLNG